MSKPVRVKREDFERVLKMMINAKPAPKVELPKSKKKLAHIIEPNRT